MYFIIRTVNVSPVWRTHLTFGTGKLSQGQLFIALIKIIQWCMSTRAIRGDHRAPTRGALFFSQSQEHMPVLQQVLGVLDLVLCACDGDDAVLRAL